MFIWKYFSIKRQVKQGKEEEEDSRYVSSSSTRIVCWKYYACFRKKTSGFESQWREHKNKGFNRVNSFEKKKGLWNLTDFHQMRKTESSAFYFVPFVRLLTEKFPSRNFSSFSPFSTTKHHLGKDQSLRLLPLVVVQNFSPIVISRDVLNMEFLAQKDSSTFCWRFSSSDHLCDQLENPQIESILYNKSQWKVFSLSRKQAVVFLLLKKGRREFS